jgi:hypothetical protein
MNMLQSYTPTVVPFVERLADVGQPGKKNILKAGQNFF